MNSIERENEMGVFVALGFIGLVAYLVKRVFDKKEKEIDNRPPYAVIACVLVGLSLQACGVEQVDEGYRGIETKWGKVVGDPLKPGLYFYNPFSTDIFEMNVKESKFEGTTKSFTRDTQNVTVGFTVTFYPRQESIGKIYSQFGHSWEETVIEPAVLGSLKDVIGLYIADDLVGKREKAKDAVQTELQEALLKRDVIVTRFDLTNLDFDDAYEQAVEAKVVAIQKAAEAKNKTVEVEENARQTVLSAKADAESMRIKSQALSQNKGLIGYEAIQKWDGKLPTMMLGNQTPILDLRNIGKSSE